MPAPWSRPATIQLALGAVLAVASADSAAAPPEPGPAPRHPADDEDAPRRPAAKAPPRPVPQDDDDDDDAPRRPAAKAPPRPVPQEDDHDRPRGRDDDLRRPPRRPDDLAAPPANSEEGRAFGFPYRRFWAGGSLGLSYVPSVVSDFGGDRSPAGGLWVRGGITVPNTYGGFATYIPQFRGHLTLGYSGRSFAAGLDLGGGAGLGAFTIGSLDVGLALRFGRVDGAHGNLLVYWWAMPPVFPFPMGAEISVVLPFNRLHAFWLQAFGDGRMGIWGAGTLGARHLLSDEPRGRTYISWGVGGAWFYPLPAGLLSVRYEYAR